MDNNRNLAAFVILSVFLMVAFNYFYEQPLQEQYRQKVEAAQKLAKKAEPAQTAAPAIVPTRDRATAIAADKRVPIKTPKLSGSVNLKGGRIDDLVLTTYRESIDPASPQIILLSPAGSAEPNISYFAEFSWLNNDAAVPMPKQDTVWKAEGTELSPQHSLNLTWDNGQGLIFERIIAIDEDYMFTITDTVRNSGSAAATLYPFGLVRRAENKPVVNGKNFITHQATYTFEGPLGVLDGTVHNVTYADLITAAKKSGESQGGWLGFTDKYWLTALIPPQTEKLSYDFTYTKPPGANDPGLFQIDYRGASQSIAPNNSIQYVTHFFAGTKALRLLDHYATQYNIPHFDRAIDFGRFYLLSEPFLYLLDWLAGGLGSFALAILAFTVILKILTLPLSIRSYRSMAKMKLLQPEIKKIQERFADDKARQGAEMLEVYKREKYNPMAGCVPILIQIPVFIALYNVLYVGIEMRQAPFYGWIKDMSIPDPTALATLFGLAPGLGDAAHTFVNFVANIPLLSIFAGFFSAVFFIGAWPIFMGISMFLQQKLSPQPPDKTQARVFMFMPIILAFTMSQMPAGLVVYWTWSNLLSIAQQWYVLKHTGTPRSR